MVTLAIVKRLMDYLLPVVFSVFMLPFGNAQSLKDQHDQMQRKQNAQDQQRSEQIAKYHQLMGMAHKEGWWIDCDGLIRVFYKGTVWWGSRDQFGGYEQTLKLPNRYTLQKGVLKWTDQLEKISLEVHLDSLLKYTSLSVSLGFGPTKCKVLKGGYSVL